MKKITLLLLTTLIALACGKQTPKLYIEPFKIIQTELNMRFDINEKGEIFTYEGEKLLNPEPIGKITTKGELIDPSGMVVGVLEGNSMYIKESNLNVTITEDGTLSWGTENFHWSSEGHFMDGNIDTKMVLYPNKPKIYQASLMVLYYMGYVSEKMGR